MSYTLVVVDMQPAFESAKDEFVIRNCRREINKAIKSKAAIIFLEYGYHFQTLKPLTDLTSKYNRVFTAEKQTDDGSNEVIKIIKANKLPSHRIKTCGVNTDYCVHDTVSGLSYQLPQSNISVIADACNSNYNHQLGLDRMATIPRVSVKK